MAESVEVRVPFLDVELVEFAQSIPSRYKQRGLTGKWVLKKAMESRLPKEVIYRGKTGFAAPLRRWIKNDLKEVVDDLLSPHTLRQRGIFDPQATLAFRKANDAGRVDGSYTIFSMMCVELWCRSFVDQQY